jgi:hypothetical protein
LKHFIQISHLRKNSEADHLFENEEESRFNFLQIKGKLPFKQTRLHTSSFCLTNVKHKTQESKKKRLVVLCCSFSHTDTGEEMTLCCSTPLISRLNCLRLKHQKQRPPLCIGRGSLSHSVTTHTKGQVETKEILKGVIWRNQSVGNDCHLGSKWYNHPKKKNKGFCISGHKATPLHL